jgi:alpha-beta hydrolase superfamily lysophospholipase
MPQAVQHAFFDSTADGRRIATYAWGTGQAAPRGVVQIAHGLAEHAMRYERLAQALVAAGYVVHAADHRGHGGSIASGGVPGDFGAGGFKALIADVAEFGRTLQARHPGLPLFLVAHSMGSFAAQSLLIDQPDLVDGVVLSGTTALDVLAAELAKPPTPGAPAGLEAFNAPFEHRTGYEWLSRDAAEVDKYVADPLCGFDLPPETMPQLFGDAARLADAAALRRIRPGLPVLLLSGDADPIAGGGALVEAVAQRYRDAGLRDVTVRLYPQARHEIFNETNRDEVTAELIDWLGQHRPGTSLG